jgi:multiple sugar transport system ATP-binding protein
MGEIRLDGLTKSFGTTEVLKGIDLTVAHGEFVVFVGPSGCGKSTLLRLIAGLEEATGGQVLIDGRDVTRDAPYDRGLSMVFQSYALYPHMSVRDNIAFGLRTARMAEPQVAAKVAEAARMLRLEALLDRRPAALSGGQRQRVAIGRAIVRDPAAFLFDEPLSNLDAALRGDTRLEIAALHRTLGATMIYVTHDQVEAMTLADRIVVLDQGRIMQAGTPRDLYDRPANLFVAGFIGTPRMNLIPCTGTAQGALLPGGTVVAVRTGEGAPATLGLRPEALRAVAPEEGRLAGTVAHVEYLGADLIAFVDTVTTGRLALRAAGTSRLVPGDAVCLSFDDTDAHLFGPDGMALRRA